MQSGVYKIEANRHKIGTLMEESKKSSQDKSHMLYNNSSCDFFMEPNLCHTNNSFTIKLLIQMLPSKASKIFYKSITLTQYISPFFSISSLNFEQNVESIYSLFQTSPHDHAYYKYICKEHKLILYYIYSFSHDHSYYILYYV